MVLNSDFKRADILTSIVTPPLGETTASCGQRLISQLYVVLIKRGAEIEQKRAFKFPSIINWNSPFPF